MAATPRERRVIEIVLNYAQANLDDMCEAAIVADEPWISEEEIERLRARLLAEE